MRRARRLPGAVVALTALLGCSAGAIAGCSRATETQPYPGGCAPFEPIDWTPMPDQVGVPRDTPLRVAFADFPDPDSLSTSSLLLTTGVFYVPGTYTVDLLGRAVVFRPAGLLRAGLGYSLSVLPPLRSLSGCPATFQQQSFVAGDTVTGAPPPPAPAFADVLGLFARSCARGCHRSADGCLDAPAEGLSLCDAEAWDALVGVPSREVARLQRVAPHDSARSYLLRKLVAAGPGAGPVPTTLGHLDPPGAPLGDADLATIAGWIDAGAER